MKHYILQLLSVGEPPPLLTMIVSTSDSPSYFILYAKSIVAYLFLPMDIMLNMNEEKNVCSPKTIRLNPSIL